MFAEWLLYARPCQHTSKYDKKEKAAWCWRDYGLYHVLGGQQMLPNNIPNNKTVIIIIHYQDKLLIINIYYQEKVLLLKAFNLIRWVRNSK